MFVVGGLFVRKYAVTGGASKRIHPRHEEKQDSNTLKLSCDTFYVLF